MVKDIGLASYLDRREIVRSSEGYKLDVMSNDWWGESPGGMLGRVLVVELAQRLPASTIYSESGAITTDPNATVGINLQRLDADKAGMLILLAQVSVEFNRPRRLASRTFTISRPMPAQKMSGLVAAISDAVGELAAASRRCCSHAAARRWTAGLQAAHDHVRAWRPALG